MFPNNRESICGTVPVVATINGSAILGTGNSDVGTGGNIAREFSGICVVSIGGVIENFEGNPVKMCAAVGTEHVITSFCAMNQGGAIWAGFAGFLDLYNCG